jgi:hypothetical protein
VPDPVFCASSLAYQAPVADRNCNSLAEQALLGQIRDGVLGVRQQPPNAEGFL